MLGLMMYARFPKRQLLDAKPPGERCLYSTASSGAGENQRLIRKVRDWRGWSGFVKTMAEARPKASPAFATRRHI